MSHVALCLFTFLPLEPLKMRRSLTVLLLAISAVSTLVMIAVVLIIRLI